MKWVISMVIGMWALVMSCNAEEFKRTDVTITKIFPIAAQRPIQPVGQNFLRVYINSGDWGATSSCRSNAVDLQKGDTHLLSVLLTAWSMGRKLDIYVDSTLKPIDDVCQVTGLAAYP